MFQYINDLDTTIFLFLNNLGTETWDPFWLRMSEVFIWIPLYLTLIVGLFFLFKTKTALWAVLAIALNVVLTDQGSVRLFKNQFERLRPCHEESIQDQIRLVKGHCGGKYGFVSSHASNSFGIAVLVGLFYRKRWPWVFYGMLFWASLVAYSRIYLGVHYPADIYFGALYGSLIGGLVYAAFLRWAKPEFKA
ncbi:MAG: phosphatase PAP2 family protein [Bacteroidetes bacterium]|nr:MAG: phosphatase PAP2 family protein [Bacteroidota bacterium]